MKCDGFEKVEGGYSVKMLGGTVFYSDSEVLTIREDVKAENKKVKRVKKSTTASQSRAEDSGMYYDKSGRFSYKIPEGWSLGDMSVEGVKYKAAFTTSMTGFKHVITIQDEQDDNPLDKYVEANVEGLKEAKAAIAEETGVKLEFTKTKPEKFTTDSGIEGLKMSIEYEIEGDFLRQILYFFERENGMKYLACGTTLAIEASYYEPLFDASIKTFQFK